MTTAFIRWQIVQNPCPYSCESQLGALAWFEINPLADDASYTLRFIGGSDPSGRARYAIPAPKREAPVLGRTTPLPAIGLGAVGERRRLSPRSPRVSRRAMGHGPGLGSCPADPAGRP